VVDALLMILTALITPLALCIAFRTSPNAPKIEDILINSRFLFFLLKTIYMLYSTQGSVTTLSNPCFPYGKEAVFI
jgi:hypothetical protein